MASYILVGRMGAGKDTVASILEAEGKKPISFAAELKRLAATLRTEGPTKTYDYARTLFVNPPDDLMEALIKFSKYPKEPKDRTLLQELGTNYCRHHEPDIWIRAMKRRMEEDTDYIITDCRFQNEFDAFAKDFVSVFLKCPDAVRHERIIKRDNGFNKKREQHESEKAIENLGEYCVMWLDTNCSMEELERRTKQMDKVVEALYGIYRMCG